MAWGRARGDEEAALWAASRGFWLVWLGHLGRRHGLVAALARGPATAGALGRRAGLDARAVRLWCEGACAVGLIAERGGRYRLPRALVPLLVDEESDAFLGGHFDYLALRSLDFDAFDALFRRGRVSPGSQRHLVEAFAQATAWDHTAFLGLALPRFPALAARLRRGAQVLDVGAGVGSFDLRMAREFPRSRFTGLEPNEAALRRARADARRHHLAGRVRFKRGSGERIADVSRFDLVFLGEVLCSAADARAILPRCRRALRPGGFLVVAEGLIDEARPPGHPANALVLALQLEFALQPAAFFTKGGLRDEFVRAGFARPRMVHAGGGLYFAVARHGRVR